MSPQDAAPTDDDRMWEWLPATKKNEIRNHMNPTILIIDDDAKLNQLLKDFLKDFGYDVITATHPARGLKKLKQAIFQNQKQSRSPNDFCEPMHWKYLKLMAIHVDLKIFLPSTHPVHCMTGG